LFKGLSLIPGVGNFLGFGGGNNSAPSTSDTFAGVPNSILDSVLNAKGNVYAKNKIVPFAYGGIVNKPTIFPMAKGAGILGEAGPEAIMPLRRGSNGKLGVEASGGVGNVVVNVDASGSRVQGDQPNAKALGSAIGAAVQAELVRQKRPGGLLS
jgi:lambda family phage tail tape measure protein